MARMLSQLLGATEPVFSLTLRQLEAATGQPGNDVRLVADIVQKARNAAAELGLDPHDTTDEELYIALLNQVKRHDERLQAVIECTRSSTVSEVMAAILREIDTLSIPKQCWALKPVAIKKVLKEHPPNTTMKSLGYKSLDSLLKRESSDVLLAAVLVMESQKWHASLLSAYRHLQPTDFEARPIRLVQVDERRWAKVATKYASQRHHNVMTVPEAGLIAILPIPIKRLPGIAITAFPLILHYLSEIRAYSTFVKLHQVAPNFSDIIAHSRQDDASSTVSIAGLDVHWRVVHQYFGKTNQQQHPELFEPHIQPEDLYWRKAEDIMADILPELAFWQGFDYVGSVRGGKPISLNLMDVAVSYCNQLDYGQQAVYHMQEALWNEIFMRYLDEQPLRTQLLEQLDSDMTDQELETMLEGWD